MGPGPGDGPQRDGAQTHARIATLRLRLPAGDARTAAALATAVAARLAERAGELGVVAGGETVRVRASASTQPDRLAETIAAEIVAPPARRRGGR